MALVDADPQLVGNAVGELTIEPIGAIPECSRQHERKERAGAGDAQDIANAEHGYDQQEQRWRQPVTKR